MGIITYHVTLSFSKELPPQGEYAPHGELRGPVNYILRRRSSIPNNDGPEIHHITPRAMILDKHERIGMRQYVISTHASQTTHVDFNLKQMSSISASLFYSSVDMPSKPGVFMHGQYSLLEELALVFRLIQVVKHSVDRVWFIVLENAKHRWS